MGYCIKFLHPGVEEQWNSSGVSYKSCGILHGYESKIVEFFRGKTLIFKEFFRGEQRFHGIFREKSTFSRISSGVDPFLREVFRGECSLVEFFRGKKKSYSSTGGVRILNAIAQYWTLVSREFHHTVV